MFVPFKDTASSELLVSISNHEIRPALRTENLSYSYKELGQFAFEMAGTIQSLFKKPQNCAVLAYRSLSAYGGVLGVLLSGGTYVPLNPRFPGKRNLSIIKSAGCSILIVDKRCEKDAIELLHQEVDPLLVLLPEYDELPDWCVLNRHRFLCKSDFQPADQWFCPKQANRYAYLLFTSGSTGTPKGVAVLPWKPEKLYQYVIGKIRFHH